MTIYVSMTSCSIVVNTSTLALIRSCFVWHLHDAVVGRWEEAGGDGEEGYEVGVEDGDERRSGGGCYREAGGVRR